MAFKSGFVAITGRPNAGKSTLMNALIKRKVAIISPKAQTTRNKIHGILTDNDSQIIFIDTPGVHQPHNKLSLSMNKMALSATKDVECVIYIVDGLSFFNQEDEFLIQTVSKIRAPIILALNKIDKIDKKSLYDLLNFWQEKIKVKHIIPISALTTDNLDNLLNLIKTLLPEGPKYYPDGMISDHPESFIIKELIREKVLFNLQQEVPHSVAVLLENIEYKNSGKMDIMAVIVCERKSQKGIIIGKDGSMIKKITTQAQKSIEYLLGNKIELTIFVKVEEDWRNSNKDLKEFGYLEDR